MKIAQRAGYRVKLLGRAVRLPGGRTAYVAPHLIPEEAPGQRGRCVQRGGGPGNATGEVMFTAKGRELPTASACVADVMGASVQPRREEIGWEADPAGFEDLQALRSRYYFRIGGSLSAAAAAFGQVEILSEDGGETAFSPTASAEPRQGSRPKACASWPVCECWDKPQTAGRLYTGTGGNRDLRLDSDLKEGNAMSLIVQKFGGTSVRDAKRIRNVAGIIAETYLAGNDVIVVLSAQGDTTDDLIAKAERSTTPSKREMDMLLSTGEQISVALCAMALEAMGLPYISWLPRQVGIQSTSVHSDARIKKIDTERIQSELDQHRIVIVTGFQGVDRNGT